MECCKFPWEDKYKGLAHDKLLRYRAVGFRLDYRNQCQTKDRCTVTAELLTNKQKV